MSMKMPDWAVQHIPEVQETFGVPVEKSPESHVVKPMQNCVKTVVQKNFEISWLNTTLIGDYVMAVFPEHSNKWLVQAKGNATFESTLEAIQQQLLIVDRQYIFFQLGGNQVRSADSNKMFTWVSNLVLAVREQSPNSSIYFISILPRPVDNHHVKPFIVKANRWLANAVDRIQKLVPQGLVFTCTH